ncbi:MAG: dockerin type I repeat-containing protein [Oscillospiraceae bacterium]|nr:dockerin type I repeat-containing protein [Oscillospiraceae bacterium]
MKKAWKRLTALLLAACAAASVPAVSVSALWYWGNAANDEFSDMTELDDKGMYAAVPYGEGICTAQNYQVLTYHYSFDREDTVTYADTGETKTELHHYEGNPVYVVCPRENVLRIVLRKDIDHDTAEQKMFEILEKYYPGITEFSRITSPETPQWYYVHLVTEGVTDLKSYYDLYDRSEFYPTEEAKTAGVPEIADAIMRDLAEAGLISEFYTWGQTANYQEITLHSRNASPTVYLPEGHKWNSESKKLETISYDWDAIEAWVKEHHPECEFVRVTLDDIELAKQIGYYYPDSGKAYFSDYDCMYAVIPPEGITFPEHFAIAAELYEQFGIMCEWVCLESAGAPITGQNALAAAGDVNLDCAVDVSDAVLLARYCAEDAKADITASGKQNADVTGDGDITQEDVTEILKMIAKIK